MYSLILMTAMAGSPQSAEFNGFFRDLLGFRGGCRGSCSGGMSMFATPSPTVSYYMAPDNGGSCFGTGTAMPAPFNFPEPGNGFAQPSATPPSSVREFGQRPDQLPPPSSGPGDASRATVIVRLPADATLFAEGRRLNLSSDTRRFVSPPLPSNGDYTYNFRVEYARGGETISRTKSVSVRAGGQFSVEFDDALSGRPAPLTPQSTPQRMPSTLPTVPVPPATVPVSVPNPTPGKALAPERARITVKMSRGATLYVDGRKNDRTEAVREFTTPPLAQGAEYTYLLKAEISRNGQPESQTVKVTFRAGEIQTVDLTQWPTGTERAGN